MGNISFVAAPPGARKTTAALNYIADHVERGSRGEQVGFIFYVVPTVALLKQSLSNLEKLLNRDEFRLYVRSVFSEGRYSKPIADQVQAMLDGRSLHKGFQSIPFAEGSVVMMCHTGFLSLRDNPLFERTTIIFDEARKWVSTVKKMQLPTGVDALFDGMFDQEQFKDSEFSIIRPKEIPANQRAALITNDASGAAYAELSAMHKALTKKCGGGSRIQVFTTKTESKFSDSVHLTSIEMPSNPFRGFREVIILSADFQTSQMYHLMRYEEIQPTNITEQFMNKWLGGTYHECLRSIEYRLSNMTILPLVDSKRMPSKHQSASGILLPRSNLVALKEKMEGLDVNTVTLRAVVEHHRKGDKANFILNSQAIELKTALKEFKASLDVMQWMLDSAVGATDRWWAQHGKTAKGVAMLNNDSGYVASEDHFTTLSIGEVEGRNEFSAANVVCFLASINPDPIVSRLLNTLLGETGYNSDEDYVIDKCIQGLGRGNIRDHNSPAEMLAIVPTTGLAERLRERMKLCPHIDYSIVKKGMTYWSHNEAMSEEDSEPEAVKTKRRQQQYLKDPLNAELAKLRKLRSKVKVQLAAAKDAVKELKYKTRLKELAAQIEEKTSLRDAFTAF